MTANHNLSLIIQEKRKMEIIKKFRPIIITLLTAFTLFGSTQCELSSSGGKDLGGELSQPTLIPTTDETALVDELNGGNHTFLNGLSVSTTGTFQGIKTFYLLYSSTEETGNIIGDASLTTAHGVLTYNIATNDTDVTGKIWLNGKLINASGSSACFWGDTTFSRGINYVAFVVYRGTTAIGRTPIVKINCNVTASSYRFELIWDGEEDLDLHLAAADWDSTSNPGAWHVYDTGSSNHKTYTATGYNVELDTYTEAYGPEDIRIYEIPADAQFKCWVDYPGEILPDSTLRNFTVNLYQDDDLTPTQHWDYSLAQGFTKSIGGIWPVTAGKAFIVSK